MELENSNHLNFDEIRSLLKQRLPQEFETILIDTSYKPFHQDLMYVNYRFDVVTRRCKTITFPLRFETLKYFRLFDQVDSQEEKHVHFSHAVINHLIKITGTQPVKISLPDSLKHHYNQPIDLVNEDIKSVQHPYAILELCNSESCSICDGDGCTICTEKECLGTHEFPCNECNATGTKKCKILDERCEVCEGKTTIPCAFCRYKKEPGCDQCSSGNSACFMCKGSGKKLCKKCSNLGFVKCNSCQGKGKVYCEKCASSGELRGKVLCGCCNGSGEQFVLTYIETEITIDADKIIINGHDLHPQITKTILNKGYKLTEFPQVYCNFNGEKKSPVSKFDSDFINRKVDDNHWDLERFPRLINSNLFSRNYPLVTVQYRHVLTNVIHELSIVDYKKSPVIVFHDSKETLKGELINTGKAIKSLMQKLLQTREYKKKEDKKKEIMLYLQVVKADGVTDESEKEMLAKLINGLDVFTSHEKHKIHDMMKAKTAPPLSLKAVTFSSREKTLEVLKNLRRLSGSDGNTDSAESAVIYKIRVLLHQALKKQLKEQTY